MKRRTFIGTALMMPLAPSVALANCPWQEVSLTWLPAVPTQSDPFGFYCYYGARGVALDGRMYSVLIKAFAEDEEHMGEQMPLDLAVKARQELDKVLLHAAGEKHGQT